MLSAKSAVSADGGVMLMSTRTTCRKICVCTRVFRKGAATHDEAAIPPLVAKLEAFILQVQRYATAPQSTQGSSASVADASAADTGTALLPTAVERHAGRTMAEQHHYYAMIAYPVADGACC